MSGEKERDAERAEIQGVRHVWEQREDESGKAFEAFRAFRDLGVTRTISEAYRQKTGRQSAKMASGQWTLWAKRYDWHARAEAFDRYVEAIEAREEEKEFAKRRRLWIGRRSEIQDAAWRVAELLTKKAEEIISLPLHEVVETETRSEDEDGKKVTVTVTKTTRPLRVTLSEGIRAAEIADKLKRLAANMATERVIVRSAAAEQAETIEDARRAFREAREMFGETEAVEETARNIAAAYALDVQQILEGYDEGQKLATQSVS